MSVSLADWRRWGALATLATTEAESMTTDALRRHFDRSGGEHSAKPDAFYDLVEAVSPAPYVELFARRARFGWDYWGDESLGTATMEAA